jgi:SAM-dependent methyltransferase
MPWESFERMAKQYARWYTTPQGQRVAMAERALLDILLAHFPTASSALEVGCGTGDFTAWLATRCWYVIGLDRAPAMVAEAQQRFPGMPLMVGDAHHLPCRSGVVDLVVFVTTLEFLEQPVVALAEAARVARQGIVLVVLNRWSLGGLSRRWGPQARRPLLGRAQDYSVRALRALVRRALGERLRRMHWTSTLFPSGLWQFRTPVPLGEVLGMVAVLATPGLDHGIGHPGSLGTRHRPLSPRGKRWSGTGTSVYVPTRGRRGDQSPTPDMQD